MSDSIKDFSAALHSSPNMQEFINFLDEKVCSPEGCYKSLDSEYQIEFEKLKKLEFEYLQLKIIESSLNQVYNSASPGSELELFHKQILPYLELLADDGSKTPPLQDPIIAQKAADLNSFIGGTLKVPINDVIDTVQRTANPLLQDLLKKRRGWLEEEAKEMFPEEVFSAGVKCSDIIKNHVDSIFII